MSKTSTPTALDSMNRLRVEAERKAKRLETALAAAQEREKAERDQRRSLSNSLRLTQRELAAAQEKRTAAESQLSALREELQQANRKLQDKRYTLPVVDRCPRCGAVDADQASKICQPDEDGDCPMCVEDDWKEALAAVNDRIVREHDGTYWEIVGENDGLREELARVRAEERERCVKVAMDMPLNSVEERHSYRWSDTGKAMAWDIAHAIRAIDRALPDAQEGK